MSKPKKKRSISLTADFAAVCSTSQPKVVFTDEVRKRMRGFSIKDAIITEIDDPKAPAAKTVGVTRKGVRIVRANRAAARKAAQDAARQVRALEKQA